MKTIVKGISAGLVLVAMLTFPAAGQGKIATIDMKKLFDNYWKKEQASAALNERRGVLEKELKGIVDEDEKAKEEYNKLLAAANDQSVTHEEREKRKSSAEAKLLEIKTIENTARQTDENGNKQLEMQMMRMRESIFQDIRAAINAKAKAAGYFLVIDVASETLNQTPTVLYTSGENDMTEEILKQLNAAAPPPTKDSPKPADNPDAKAGDKK